jgi:hypothetical protein
VLRGRFVAHLRIAHVDPHATDLESAGRRILAPMLGSGAKIDDYTTVIGPGDSRLRCRADHRSCPGKVSRRSCW